DTTQAFLLLKKVIWEDRGSEYDVIDYSSACIHIFSVIILCAVVGRTKISLWRIFVKPILNLFPVVKVS
ncbi:hypothetical protein NQ674_17440, partial [Acinetobacter baumannii]|nr:hypothetical protein [Acinetobacter baumannii]